MIVLGLLIFPFFSVAEGMKPDGEMWRMEGMGTLAKYAMITGFREGLVFGFLATAVSFEEKQGPDYKDFQTVCSMWAGYMDNASLPQTSDGLDTFYADYRNRNVLIRNAIWVVVGV